jgi:hypothetical protein
MSRRSRLTTTKVPGLRDDFRAFMDTRGTSTWEARETGENLDETAGPRIGFACFGAGANHLVVDCLLAHALQLRGADCQLFVCDLPELPGCDERLLEEPDNERCAGCINSKLRFLQMSGLEWFGLTHFLPDAEAALATARAAVAACPDDELTTFEFEGWPVGHWLGTSVASFLRSDSHGLRPEVIAARRRYLVSGIVGLIAARSWLDHLQPDIVIVLSGRHVMWRAAREIAQSRGIKVVAREMFNEDFDCHIYAVNASCEDPALPHAWAEAQQTPLTAAQDQRVDAFLDKLPAFARQVSTDPVLQTDPDAIRAELGLDPARPFMALFTNVTWDLFVAERDAAFDGQMEWLRATLDFIRRHPEIDLVVRAHPAEIVPRFRTRGRIVHQITEAFSPLPDNVRLVGPESDISSDVVRSMATMNLVYCASVGLEAVIAGQPVLICGNPYYARKGFTIDVDSPEHYERLLHAVADGTIAPPAPQSVELARRYLYLIKFRYGMHMGLTTDQVTETRLEIRNFGELLPGRSLPLDTACDGSLHGDEILLPP